MSVESIQNEETRRAVKAAAQEDVEEVTRALRALQFQFPGQKYVFDLSHEGFQTETTRAEIENLAIQVCGIELKQLEFIFPLDQLYDAYYTAQGEFALLFSATEGEPNHAGEMPLGIIRIEDDTIQSIEGLNFGMLMQGITDFQWLRFAPAYQIRARLQLAIDCDNALALLCIAIDPEDGNDLRTEALAELEASLADAEVNEWLLHVVSTKGETITADYSGAQALAQNYPLSLAILEKAV